MWALSTWKGTGYSAIIYLSAISSIDQELYEAAVVDGAGYLKRFLRIILPLSKPILATVSIFTAVGQWNSYIDTVLYMTKGQYQTLQSIVIPILLVYPFFQRYFTKGIMIGAVKG